MRHSLGSPTASVLVRLDGLYGDAAPCSMCSRLVLAVIARSRAYHLLDLEVVKQALARAPDQVSTHPESGMTRALYDCAAVPLTPAGPEVRLVVATHPAPTSCSPPLASSAMAPSTSCLSARFPPRRLRPRMCLICTCTVARLRRCWPMKTRSKRSDRWYSHTPWGQEFAQILASGCGTCDWSWGNSSRQRNCAPPNLLPHVRPNCLNRSSLHLRSTASGGHVRSYRNGHAHRLRMAFPGSAFTPQPDGTLRCPANHPLYLQERRPERDGSLRILYAARIGHCRSCPLRAQCQESSTTLKPRRVSAVLWPLSSAHSAFLSTCSDPASHQLPLLQCSGATGHAVASGDMAET